MQIANNIDELLEACIAMNGTDLHISVGAQPKARVFGELKSMDYNVLKPVDVERILLPLLDAYARTQLTSKGQYDMSYSIGKTGRFRVNIFRQKGDMAGVFRVLPSKVPDYQKLGLPVSVFNLYRKRRGLILIVGPTGSGKTTTLASFLDVINKNTSKHIVTLEDPIEYVHWHSKGLINQREIGSDCDSFASGLRAALREDPDVILVGEMRDLETTEIAVTSAETGHLVCSTLHTLGASETINRILDMYPERQQNQVRSQLVSILEAVVSQQLLPRADGKGYVVAYEILFKNKEVQKLIGDRRVNDLDVYLKSEEAMREGMVSMDNTIISLYKKGLITRATALDYAFDRKEMTDKI